MPLRVISECVDAHTGRRFYLGDLFPEGDAAQVQRLGRAGCLRLVSEAELSADEQANARPGRRESEVELDEIDRILTAARKRRDDELAAIADELGKALSDADAEKARIIQEVEALNVNKQTDGAAVARQQINEDGLFERTVPELREIAETEQVDLAGASKKDDIIAAIRAKRAPAPAV